MEWYTLFRPHILERGSGYYEDGLVTGFEYSDNEITAQVAGSDTYDVQIELDGEDVLDMYCSCPYAADGHNCKHMAAVLFRFEEELEARDTQTERESDDIFQWDIYGRMQKDKKEVTELVAKIPEDKVRELLVGFVLSDESLRNRLQMRYSFKMDSKLMLKLRTELEQIQYRYGRDGFVDWYHASDFASELVGFLCEKVMFLIERSCLKQAFELTNEVFYCIGNTDMDDSDGSSSYVADQCYECWKQILEKSDEDFKAEIRKWFETHKTGYVADYMDEYIEEFILNEFADRQMIEKEIQKLDAFIDKYQGNDCGNGYYYSVHYGYVNPVLKRIEYMRKMGCTDEEIREYRQANRHFSVIREMEISEAREKGDYKSAVSILLESKELDANNKEQLKKYSEQLIDIYRETGSEAAYCEELIYHLENFWQGDLSYVNALKKCISDQEYWKTVVDNIVAKNRYDEFVCNLLQEERRYEQLMEKIENSVNKVSLLDDHGRILRKRFPERIIKIYSDYLKREAEMANDRKKYKRLMPYLKKIAGCAGGAAAAQEIADSWKREYRRRSAMMDELKKAGF